MKRMWSGLLVVLAIAVMVGSGNAAGPPVLLGHTLTAYSPGSATVTADYSLHLENQGDAGLSDLTLTLVSLPPLFAESTTLNVGYLAPHEKRDLFVQVAIPVRLDAAQLSGARLFWAASYRTVDGKTAGFAVTSRPGGAK